MKTLKKAAALISAATLAVSLCACSQTPKVPEIPKDPYDAIFEEFNGNKSDFENEEIYTEPETTVPQFIGYESENIEIFGESYELKDRVAKFVDDRYQVAQDKDGKFFSPYGGWDVFRDKDVADYCFTRNYQIYKDSNGIYHADEYLFTEVKGEIFYAFYSSFSGEFYVFSIDKDGTMYLNAFTESGKLAHLSMQELLGQMKMKYSARLIKSKLAITVSSISKQTVKSIITTSTQSTIYLMCPPLIQKK